jgi:hypothetical protein
MDPFQETESSKNGYIAERDVQLSAINTTADLFALNTTDVSVEQGVLCFKDSATLERVLSSISLLEGDSAFYHDYKASIGILPNSSEDEEFPYMAAYHAFGQRFSNFYTYYEKTEDAEVLFLENGGSPSDIPENDIQNENLQVILNEYKEVKIGNLIYKYLNEDQFFVITANDFDQLSVLRSLTDPFSAKQRRNTTLIDSRVLEDLAIYKEIIKNSNQESGGPCEASIQTFKTAPNTYKIVNTSIFYNCSQQNVSWKITDGNDNIIFTSSITDYFTYTIPDNTILPVKVTITVSGQCCTDSEQVTLVASNEPGSEPCDNSIGNGFSLSIKDEVKMEDFLFVINGLIPAGIGNFGVSWNFGDGSPVEIKQNSTLAAHHYIFPSGVMPYTVTVLITWGNGCFKEIKLTFEAGCGVQTYRTVNLLFADAPFNGNYYMRLNQTINNDGDEYSAKITFYKKNGNGNFKKSKADGMTIDMTGLRIMKGCIETGLKPYINPISSVFKQKSHRARYIASYFEYGDGPLSTKTGLTRVRFILRHLEVEKPFYMHLLS